MRHSTGPRKVGGVPLLGLRYGGTYHSEQVGSAAAALGYWRRKDEAHVWHVNSNHSTDIHQAAWPTVGINLGMGRLAKTPLCFLFFSPRLPSVARYRPLPVFPSCCSSPRTFSCLPPFALPFFPPRLSYRIVINQRSDWVGGKGCSAHSLMPTGWRNHKFPAE